MKKKMEKDKKKKTKERDKKENEKEEGFHQVCLCSQKIVVVFSDGFE